MKIDFDYIFELQLQNKFETIIEVIDASKINKSTLARDYASFLLKKFSGSIQRTEYGPLLVNRNVIEYYVEFIVNILK